ncbi:MAG: glycosyltransferase family 4 protein [Proteobacteria bacterium]|nr:glycosyltransferase family 4 protein [Pseudomonadota bacterium]
MQENGISPVDTKHLTFYFLVGDWDGLHTMFETEDWDSIAGVPLVPLYWKHLVQKGHEVHVVATGDFSSDKDFMVEGIHIYRRYVADWLTPGLRVGRHSRPIRTYFKIGLIVQTSKALKAVIKAARTSPPDVIYSYRRTFILAGYLLSHRYRVPHLVHYWGTWSSHYLFNVPWYKRLPIILSKLALKIPMDLLIISNDGTEGDKAIKKLKFPEERFRFWLDGTAPDIYKPNLDVGSIKESIGLKSTDKMIFQAVRLDFWKRVDRSIDALPEILKQVPETYLVVAGDGNLREDLERQARLLGVSDHVKFLGFVPHNKVLELHNAADLFLTVQDLTNLGNQIMEALHSGTCVIAYNVGGTSQVMRDGVTGMLLEEKDLCRLGVILGELLADDERRQKLARGALEFARKNIWTWEERISAELKEVEKLVRAYRKNHR